MRLKPRNLFVKPRSSVVSLEPGEGGRTIRLRVEGMVCGI